MYNGRSCWLCGKNGCGDPLDKHHIFGGAYRDKSEKYGLYVDLCHESCHIFGRYAAHKNAETMEMLRKYGQIKAMKEQGWSVEEFIMEFGKNHLEPAELEELYAEEPECESSFCIIDGPELPF